MNYNKEKAGRNVMEKIIGINPVTEVLKSDKNIEKIEVYKGIKKDTIKEI